MKPSAFLVTAIPALALVLGAAGPAFAQRSGAPGPGSGRAAAGRPVVGQAVPRPIRPIGPPIGRPGVRAPYRPYYPYRGYAPYYRYPYYGYGYGYPYYGYPYGFGIGFSFSFGYPYVYGVSPYVYGGYPSPYYYGYVGYGYPATPYGEVRIQGGARDAQVFVDNYYAGIVDDFDGTFQRLSLTPGTHQIEIRRPGAAPLSFDVRIDAGRSITYHATTEP
jgi:hypothetical protein